MLRYVCDYDTIKSCVNKKIMELLRNLMFVLGWPILIIGSIFIVSIALRFYYNVGRTVLGKLVLWMIIGWFVSMYSLGITASAFTLINLEQSIPIVLPIFIIWCITMLLIFWVILRWSREAVTLNAFYQNLEKEVKERTEELKNAYEQHLRNEQEIGVLRERFIFIAAHELRTPVTAIEWGLGTILEDSKFQSSLPKNYRELLQNMRDKNRKLLELVRDLLNTARIQNNSKTLELEDISISDIIQDVQETVRSMAENAEIQIYWLITEKSFPLVRANPFYLKEVFTNLITNAIRYNKPGGWVKIDAEMRSTELIVHVEDNGIGMTPDGMEKLFQEFYRIKSPETKKIEGTGLGLFITKHLLERMNGKIRVESKKDKGSAFIFSIPFAASSTVTHAKK